MVLSRQLYSDQKTKEDYCPLKKSSSCISRYKFYVVPLKLHCTIFVLQNILTLLTNLAY